MNQFYDIGIARLLEGTLDLLTDPLVVAAYPFNGFSPWMTTIADFSGSPTEGTSPQPLAGRSVNERALRADNITYTSVSDQSAILSLTLYRSSDGLLVAYIDTRADRMGIHVNGNGGPVEVAWPDGVVMRL